MWKKWLLRALALALAFALFSGLGMLMKKGVAEKYVFTKALSEEETIVVGDLSKQLLPKKLLQPGYLDFTSGHRGGITNDTGKAVKLQVVADGSPYDVELKSTSPGFDALTGVYGRAVEDGAQVTFEALVRIPRGELKNASGQEIVVHFLNADTGENISDLVLRIA